MKWLLLLSCLAILSLALNFLSYRLLKKRILKKRKWDLNICCGKTDGGGINADIIHHTKLPRFVLIDSIYSLPFKDHQFETVLCSHTLEHVEDPVGFYKELTRVGKQITIVLPPLWDFAGVLNVFEHRWIFLTLKKVHTRLPAHVRLPLSRTVQRILRQRIRA
ncbi:MAG: methyltransferase domain-containing protein [Clostridiales bacterium]|nr:methyltransferase domain-containing protein [Clostridiales bacterium]